MQVSSDSRACSAFPYAYQLMDLWRGAGKEIPLTLSGTSMEPLLRAGDVVTVRCVPPEELKRGDLIAFREHGCIIVHRLIGKGRRGDLKIYCQKGDNQIGWGWVQENAIIGKVVSVERQDLVAEMQQIPWRGFNPVAGLWAALFVSLWEALYRTKQACFGNRPLPGVTKAGRVLAKAIFLPRLPMAPKQGV
jgi:signal peptidase I